MTIAIAPSALTPDLLTRRLRELAGEERDVQVDFLLHLDEFDRRRAFLEAGFGSLWEYCLRALHLREGPAGRRIAAMRILRRFPTLAPALRDGRLCLSTVTLVAPLLTEENLEEVVARAAFRTKAEVEHLAASIQPRAAPKDGVRRLAQGTGTREESVAPRASLSLGQPATRSATLAPGSATATPVAPRIPAFDASSIASIGDSLAPGPMTPEPAIPAAPRNALASSPLPATPRSAAPRAATELRPVSGEEWSLRVTLDAQMKADLDDLKALLGHKAGGDVAAIVREALRCAVEKHGRRRGAVRSARTRNAGAAHPLDAKSRVSRPPIRESPPASTSGEAVRSTAATREEAARTAAPTRHVAAAVRRAVWERDGGSCAWTSSDGRRCGSTWKLELDHVLPVALGGPSTIANLRPTCRAHNVLHAEQRFGREHMARFAGPRARADAQVSLIPG